MGQVRQTVRVEQHFVVQCMVGFSSGLAAGISTVITLSEYTIIENFYGARMVLRETERVSLEKLQLWHATASTS